jgi:membrane protein involved in D-alanine export
LIPYAQFSWFAFLLYPVVPTIVAGLLARITWRWIVFWTVVVLAVQFGGTTTLGRDIVVQQFWLVAAYGLYEYLVASWFVRVREKRRWKFRLAVVLALLPLVAAKSHSPLAAQSAIGFLGISYVTFRVLDVIICSNDGLITELPPMQFGAYVFFFPTISAGPIDRYRRFAIDWRRTRTRAEFLQDLDFAVHRVFTGFLYKFILAALIKTHWLDRSTGGDFLTVVSYMYAYSFYLFFDFAGYSGFAIGLSYVFGIHTPENFNRPFAAPNIREFWNRWHITLSWWFRDHIYMRFMLMATKRRWFGNQEVASIVALLLTFGLMGLWHGAEVHYIAYGLYHALLLSAYGMFARWNKSRHVLGQNRWSRWAGVVLTFNAVCFGFLIFSGRLTHAPNAHSATPKPEHEAVIESLVGIEGRLEVANKDIIAGRAWDSQRPDAQLNVDIYDNGRLIATVRADGYRRDLKAANYGNGFHGFQIPTPLSLRDGRRHEVRAKLAGSDIDLKDGLRVVGGESPSTPR